MTDAFGRDYPMSHVTAAVGPGWSSIVSDLIHDLKKMGWDGELHQIKEKYGGLRFYIGGGSDAIFKRIDDAERDSLKTCEECGAVGEPRTENFWVATRCEKHAKY
jgi:hypothetical protein